LIERIRGTWKNSSIGIVTIATSKNICLRTDPVGALDVTVIIIIVFVTWDRSETWERKWSRVRVAIVFDSITALWCSRVHTAVVIVAILAILSVNERSEHAVHEQLRRWATVVWMLRPVTIAIFVNTLQIFVDTTITVIISTVASKGAFDADQRGRVIDLARVTCWVSVVTVTTTQDVRCLAGRGLR
jgi:hypothetical protein